MKKSQSGFTLIELVVVIVLLGILGVTALGRFQDLSGDAQAAANSGVASEISAAAAINYAESLVGTTATAITATAGNDDCADANLNAFFTSGAFPTGQFDATAVGTPNCTATGVTYQCQISANGVAAVATDPSATIICTGG